MIGAHYDHVGYGTFGSLGGPGRPRQDPLRGGRQCQRHHRPHGTGPALRRDEGPAGPPARLHRLLRRGARPLRLHPLLQGAALPAGEDRGDDQHGHDRPHQAGPGRLARHRREEGPAHRLRDRHRRLRSRNCVADLRRQGRFQDQHARPRAPARATTTRSTARRSPSCSSTPARTANTTAPPTCPRRSTCRG